MLPSKSASTSNIRTEGLREISIQSSQRKLAPPRTHSVHETQMHRKPCHARKGTKGKAHKPLGEGRQVERNNHQPDKSHCQRQRGTNPQNKGSASRRQTNAQGNANIHNGIPGNYRARSKRTPSLEGIRTWRTRPEQPHKATPPGEEHRATSQGNGSPGGTHNRQGRPESKRQQDASGKTDQNSRSLKTRSKRSRTSQVLETQQV